MAASGAGLRVSTRAALGGLLLVALSFALALGVYASAHTPAARPIGTFGFSGMLQMKAWFTTAAAVLGLVQVTTAASMWGRLPGVSVTPAWVSVVHRWTGTALLVVTLPVAVHCTWSLGFATSSPRVVVHGVVGCLFYGAFAAKMLGLRARRLPRWALPVLGGVLFALLMLLWLTSALWFFTRSGVPLT